MVTSARRGRKRASGERGGELERFGDGRDDSDDSAGIGDEEGEVDDDMDDEEFGDFAMPYMETAPSGSQGPGGEAGNESATPSTDMEPAREKILLKPLPVHPSSSKFGTASASSFGSLWPFSSQGFSSGGKAKGEEGKKEGPEDGDNKGNEEESSAVLSEEPLELGPDDVVIGEDGKRINRAVEAKRRTSIEDPDEDEEEMRLGAGAGAR